MALTRITSEFIQDQTAKGLDIEPNSIELDKLLLPQNMPAGFVIKVSTNGNLEYSALGLADIADVTPGQPDVGDVLTWSGAGWVAAPPQGSGGSGTGTLDDLIDVTLTNPTAQNFLKFDGSQWLNASIDYSDIQNTPTLVTSITELTDVNAFAPQDNDILHYDSTSSSWIASQNTVSNIGDVNVTSLADDQILKYDTTSSKWINVTADLNMLADVDVTGAVNGQVLKFDSVLNKWVPRNDLTGSGGSATLSGLTDVTLSALSSGDFLKYDGVRWANVKITYSDILGTPSLSTVATSGDYNDLINLPTVPSTLNDLADVTTTGATIGQVLKFTGSGWTPQNDNGDVTNLSTSQLTSSVTIISSNGSNAVISSATTTEAGVMSATDKVKLDGIDTGAQVNQNAFSRISVPSQSDIVADTETDVITLVGGTNITITTDPITDRITIDADGAGASTLNDLTDVDTATTPPANGDALMWNSANSKWEPQSIVSAGVNTSVERVVLEFQAGDTLVQTPISTTSGVSVTSWDNSAANVTGFTFSGYNLPPAQIMIYAQDVTNGFWNVVDGTSLVDTPIQVADANGTTGAPDLINDALPFNTEWRMGLSKANTKANHKASLPTIYAKLMIVFIMQG